MSEEQTQYLQALELLSKTNNITCTIEVAGQTPEGLPVTFSWDSHFKEWIIALSYHFPLWNAAKKKYTTLETSPWDKTIVWDDDRKAWAVTLYSSFEKWEPARNAFIALITEKGV